MNAKRFARHHLAAAAYPRGYGAARPDNECFLFCPHPSRPLMTFRLHPSPRHPSPSSSSLARTSAKHQAKHLPLFLLFTRFQRFSRRCHRAPSPPRERHRRRVSIPASFRLVAEVRAEREPMESFLISDENGTATEVHSRRAHPSTRRPYFRSVLPRRRFSSFLYLFFFFYFVVFYFFFFFGHARSAMIHGRLFLTEAALFGGRLRESAALAEFYLVVFVGCMRERARRGSSLR